MAVDLHKDLNFAVEGIRKKEYCLVILEPFEFANPRRKSAVLQVLTETKAKSIPILVYSTQTPETLAEKCGVTDTTYDTYISKVGTKPEDFYKKVAEMLNINKA